MGPLTCTLAILAVFTPIQTACWLTGPRNCSRLYKHDKDALHYQHDSVTSYFHPPWASWWRHSQVLFLAVLGKNVAVLSVFTWQVSPPATMTSCQDPLCVNTHKIATFFQELLCLRCPCRWNVWRHPFMDDWSQTFLQKKHSQKLSSFEQSIQLDWEFKDIL